MNHKTIHMIPSMGGYRPLARFYVANRVAAGLLHLESVEGDEEANTVTQWYGLGQRELCLDCPA